MSTIKTATSALTAALLVSGIGLAWAQTEDAQQAIEPTPAVSAMPSEQTPADPNTVPLTDNSAATTAQQTTTPPAVDSTTPAPMSSDANSQAPQSTTTAIDNSTTTTTTPAPEASAYEPAPRADRN